MLPEVNKIKRWLQYSIYFPSIIPFYSFISYIWLSNYWNFTSHFFSFSMLSQIYSFSPLNEILTFSWLFLLNLFVSCILIWIVSLLTCLTVLVFTIFLIFLCSIYLFKMPFTFKIIWMLLRCFSFISLIFLTFHVCNAFPWFSFYSSSILLFRPYLLLFVYF